MQTCWLVSLSSGTAAVVFRDLSTGAAHTPTHVPSDKCDAAQTSIHFSKKQKQNAKVDKEKTRVDYLV